MKKVEAIIRPERLSAVREVLDKNGFPGMSATEIKGRGRQEGVSLQWRAGDYKVEFLPKVKLEVVVEDGDADRIVDLICDAAHTGEAGDGKIFVYPVIGRGEGSDEGEGVGGGIAGPSPGGPTPGGFGGVEVGADLLAGLRPRQTLYTIRISPSRPASNRPPTSRRLFSPHFCLGLPRTSFWRCCSGLL